MRVRAKSPDELEIPPEIEPYCRQRFITVGREYEVHAVAVCLGSPAMILFQIVDDFESPVWFPHLLFEIIEGRVAADWCCNVLGGTPDTTGLFFVIGPEFVVKDADSFDGMVEHDLDQMELFWKRLGAIEKEREFQRWLEELDKEESEGK